MEFLHPDNEELQSIVEYNKQVLKALGVEFGPAHSEIMLTTEGPVLIEVGARIHGGYTPLTVQKFSSASQLELTAYAYVDPKKYLTATNNPYPTYHSHALVYFFINRMEGFVSKLAENESLKRLDSYFDSVWHISEKAKAPKKIDLFTAPGWGVLINENISTLMKNKLLAARLEENNELYQLEDINIH